VDDLDLALTLADAADAITVDRYRASDLKVESKPDLSPVTDADRAVESAIRELLAEHRPTDAVIGEEYGSTGDGERQWIVDPIDGTKNFVRGVPVWATLLAVREGGATVVGVVSAPALGRRWWASRSSGAWTRDVDGSARLCQVSSVSRLEDASLSYSSLYSWEPAGRMSGFLTLARHCWRTRAYGDFLSHLLVAEGAVDISCEPEVSLWDLAALHVVVEEAGGTFTNLAGEPGPAGGSVVCSNGLLHTTALALLARE
jgi:histidinol-phosphatase